MDKQKELNAYEQMAVVCARWFSCGTCPYNPEANKESICPNFDKKLVYALGKGYRKITEGSVVLTREEYEKLDLVKEMYGCEDKVKVSDILNMLKYTDKTARKETAEKFAEMLKEKCKELQDKYSHMCKNKYEAIQETCRYEGVTTVKNSIDEICKEITEGKV